MDLRRLRNSVLARNTAALYAVHVAGLVLPLVTIPYLARVLRPDGWGLVVFAQSFAAWLTLVLEYGFYLSGTRMLARVRDRPDAVGRVVARVQSAKLFLLAVGALIAVAAYLAIPAFARQPEYLLWAAALAAVQGLNPFWYFQGIERMAVPAALEVAARVTATVGIFVVVTGPGDGWRVLALQAVAGAVWVMLATLWMYGSVGFSLVGFRTAMHTLREAGGLFLFRGFGGVYTQANSFILGLLASTSAVAFFGGAEKIARAATSLIQPVSQALYPRMSHLITRDRRGAIRVVRASLVAVTGLGIVIGVAILLGAPLLVRVLLGPGYEAAVPVLRALALIPPLVALGTVLGIQWALPLGLDRVFYGFVFGAAVINVALAVWLAPRWGASGMAVAVVAAEAFVALGLLLYARSRGGEHLRRMARSSGAREPVEATAEAAAAGGR